MVFNLQHEIDVSIYFQMTKPTKIAKIKKINQDFFLTFY